MKTTCPECGTVFDGDRCPKCGGSLPGEGRSLLKTSTILISTGTGEGIYRSLAEVPQPLRRKLLRSTTGANAGTILIADRKGREEISRALGRAPVPWHGPARKAAEAVPAADRWAIWWRAGAAGVLVLAVILLWLAIVRG